MIMNQTKKWNEGQWIESEEINPFESENKRFP